MKHSNIDTKVQVDVLDSDRSQYRASFVPKVPEHYERHISVRKALPAAYSLYMQGEQLLASSCRAVAEHAPQPLLALQAFVDACVENILKNPDTLACLAMLDSSQQPHRASLRSAMLAALMAWHLGLKPKRIKVLVMGCLLAYLGKTQLSPEILDNEDFLTSEQQKRFERYPLLGEQLLTHIDGLPKAVLAIVAQHRERFDGSGFPLRLGGNKQHSLAQIASICIYYQELLSFKAYADGLSVLDANTQLFHRRGQAFDQQVVEQFIESVGLYPSGSLVELSDGKVAMVLEQGRERRLLPSVLLLLDQHKRPYKKARELDLALEATRHNVEGRLVIHASLPCGAYDLSLEHARIQSLVRKSIWSFG